MIHYLEGDIFSSPAQVIVNTVNTVGVMGKGIALEYKKHYPEMYDKYRELCETQQLTIGRLMLWYGRDHWILNFPTKKDWRKPSKIEYVEAGLQKFAEKYLDYNIFSIAFPPLGCGNGGLEWTDVQPLMEKYLGNISAEVYIYLGKKDEKRSPDTDGSDWILEKARDLSFVGLEDNLMAHISMVPLTFPRHRKKWDALWLANEKTLRFQHGKEDVRLNENSLHEKWDLIRAENVFADVEDETTSVLYHFLAFTGYLKNVELQLPESGMQPAFQLDLGMDRRYQFEGE